MSVAAAIEVNGLIRDFGPFRAVDGVSFTIPYGQVVGFVGANGAGKTTTMRILATLDAPSEGTAFIGGHDVVEAPHAARAIIGWMPDDYGTYANMTVLEYLDFFARAHNLPTEERVTRVREVAEFTELDVIGDRFIDKLSKGMGQRLCLGRALIHDPDILILDEPAAGLDPAARLDLKNLLRILAEGGKTIFISSHILTELGEMCDSLLIIRDGRILHHGSAESIIQEKSIPGDVTMRRATIRVLLDGEDESEAASDRIVAWAEMTPGVSFGDSIQGGARLLVEDGSRTASAKLLRRMISDGLPVADFHREERRLEDAFVDLMGSDTTKR